MKKILIILIITLSLIFIFYINENFCNINECKPYAILSNKGKACCINDNNAISFDGSCIPTCKPSFYILNNKCTPCHTRIKSDNTCCTELQGADAYNDDCSIRTYKRANEETLSVYGEKNQDKFIMNVPGGDSTIKYTDRPLQSYKSSKIWDEYIIYYDTTDIKYRIEYFQGNITITDIKKFRAISRKFVNFFSDSYKTELIDQINPDTLKSQDYVDKNINVPCFIELPPGMYLDNLKDKNFISVKNGNTTPIDISIKTTDNNFRCILFKATNLNIYLDVNYKNLIKSIDVSNIPESKDVPEGIFYSANTPIKSINVPNGITVDFFRDASNSEDSFIARLLGSQSQQNYYENLNTKIENVYKLIYYKTKKLTEEGPDVDGEIYQNICYTNNKSCSKNLCCSETTNKCVNSVNVDNNNNGFCNISRVMYSGGYKTLL